MLKLKYAERTADIHGILCQSGALPKNSLLQAYETKLLLAMERAIDLGLSHVNDIVGYTALACLFGDDFDKAPAVRRFFARTDLPPAGRIIQMMRELPLVYWNVVQQRGSVVTN